MKQQPLTTYLKLCTEFYDLDKGPDKDLNIMDFYLQKARHAQGPILEPMCGTGRFLIPMLEAGLDATGFDASPYMLDAFRQKWPHQPAPFWQQFVQNFSSDLRYNLIFVPFGSWGLITDADDAKKSLASMYYHLAPGGTFILEIETVASVPYPCGIWRRGLHTRADGSRIAINTMTSYDPTTQLFQALCRYESLVDGVIVATETEDFKQHLFRFDEMDTLLRDAGFVHFNKYQDYQLTPATNEMTHIIIYECTK